MRRAILLMTIATVALLAASGVALAITKTCKVGVVCKGTLNNDVLTGTKQADTIKALAGADTIRALGANDKINGGDGNDTYAFGGRWGKDVITADASGTDTADFSAVGGGGNPIEVDLTTKAGSEVFNSIYGTVNWPGSVIENVNGGAGTDFVDGSAADNVLRGNGGGDGLWGGLGDDSLYAGDGSDELDGGDGNDTLEAGGGGRPGEFDDTLVGGAGNDTIMDTGPGSPDDVGDILEGGAGDDELRAGADGDILNGNAGNDTLYGQGGDDIYVFGQGWGTDEIVETDLSFIQFSGHGTTVSTNLTVDLVAGTATDGANVLTFPGQHISGVHGGDGNDDIRGNAVPNFVVGEGGDDVIDVAGGGRDGVICGDGNNDHVKYDASDTIYVGCEHFTYVP